MNWANVYLMLGKSRAKYPFYEGTFAYADYESSKIAKRLAKSRVGWGSRAIDIRANKTHFDRFENDTLGLNEIFDRYKGQAALNKIKEDILVCGCGFLAVAGDRIMPFTALEATGTYDWYTQNLKDGVAIFKKSKEKNNLLGQAERPDSYMIFSGTETVIYYDGIGKVVPNNTGRPLISMLTHKSSTKQPFGRTVLTTPARDAITDASRTRRQAMIAAYHYNKKVDVVLGVDSETDVDIVNGEAGDILKVGTNENGQIPQIGEFAQHAMAPFNDSISMAAKDFCAATKLSMSSLSLGGNAPSNPEALSIVGDDLRDDISEWQAEIGEQIKHLAVTLWMLENNITELDANLQAKIDKIKVAWLPIFRADVSKFGDGLTKIAEKAPAITTQRSIWRNLGLTSSEIDEVTKIPEVV